MKQMLEWQKISRQGAHKGVLRLGKQQRDVLDTIELAGEVRRDHRQMGCRDIYYARRDQMPRGRDWTEQVLLNTGYRVKTPTRSFTVAGTNICSNLIEGMRIKSPNQVWQTDITYVWAGNRWYYISFVIDVYTRRIIASHSSRDLSGESQVRCLEKAVKANKKQGLKGLIIHTDRGVQYTSDVYKKYLSRHQIRHSMAQYAWQNAYCERVNRTIKHNYLAYFKPDDYDALQRAVSKAVRLYNQSKPHRSLPLRLSPDQFVKELNQGNFPDYQVKIWSKLTDPKMLNVN